VYIETDGSISQINEVKQPVYKSYAYIRTARVGGTSNDTLRKMLIEPFMPGLKTL
jgi:hypothetical protein